MTEKNLRLLENEERTNNAGRAGIQQCNFQPPYIGIFNRSLSMRINPEPNRRSPLRSKRKPCRARFVSHDTEQGQRGVQKENTQNHSGYV